MSTIQGDDTFLDIENAHLRVTGNVHAENVNLGAIRVNPTYGLSTVTNVGNTTSNTVQFTNPTTSLTTTGNVEIGGILTLNTVQLQTNETLASVTNVGNATSETVQFTNPTTSFVTSGNVEVAKELTVTGNVEMTGTGAITLPSGTSAEQPTGVTGMIRFNTTVNRLEVYNGNVWQSLGGVSATGGTVTQSGGYKIHTFTSDGTFTVNSGGDAEYLVVGGGGGGGSGLSTSSTRGTGGGFPCRNICSTN